MRGMLKELDNLQHLKIEFKTFLKNLSSMLKEHPGEHVLIKEEKILGYYSSRREGLKQGLLIYGNDCFLVRKIEKIEDQKKVQGLFYEIDNSFN